MTRLNRDNKRYKTHFNARKSNTEVYLEPCQTFMIEVFTKTFMIEVFTKTLPG